MHLPKRYSTAVSPLFSSSSYNLPHLSLKHPLPLSYGGFQMPAWILYARRNRQTSAYLSPRLAPSFYDKLDSGHWSVWKYALCSRTLYPGKHKVFPVFRLLKEVSFRTLDRFYLSDYHDGMFLFHSESACICCNLTHKLTVTCLAFCNRR